jgi:hypothetical protein
MRILLLPLFVVGCTASNADAGQDMTLPAATCATQMMKASKFTGEAKGALDRTAPIIAMLQPDAVFYEVSGTSIDTLSGETDPGNNGGLWEVNYYSPSAKRQYKGVFSSDVGHVSCQDVKIREPPATQALPRTRSPAVLKAAFDRIVADIKARDPKLKIPAKAFSVKYGVVTLGINEPRGETWAVALNPWNLLIDDASGDVADCAYNGNPCK